MTAKSIPAYRRHSTKDQGISDVYRDDGKRTKIYFPGSFNSPESMAAYAKLVALIAAHGGKLPSPSGSSAADDKTIEEFVLEFMDKRVAVYYQNADGTPKREAENFRNSLRPLVRLFGPTLARDFDAVFRNRAPSDG